MLRSLIIQLFAFLLIFQLISWFQTSDMLSGDQLADKAPLSLVTVHDEVITLNANGSTKILYFFAPWCQICHASIGNLQAIYEKNEKIKVLAIALDYASQNDVLAFTAKHQLTFPIAYGNEAVKKYFKIQGYPSYYVLDEENKIISKSIGYSTELGLLLRSL